MPLKDPKKYYKSGLKDFKYKDSDPSKLKPSTQHKKVKPANGLFKTPKNGEQSLKLSTKKSKLPLDTAPVGVEGPNGGVSVPFPKDQKIRG